MWAIPNTVALWIRTRHLFPTLLQSLGFNIWCAWNSFPPYFSSSQYPSILKLSSAKVCSQFQVKGKAKKRKKPSRIQQDLWILNLLKNTPYVQTAAESLNNLQSWVHHRLLINHLRCPIYTQPSSVIGAAVRRHTHTPHDGKRKQRWANVSPAVLKTESSRMQMRSSMSRPEIRPHSAYHTGHSGLLTAPHHQVCVQTKTHTHFCYFRLAVMPLYVGYEAVIHSLWQRDRAKADVLFSRCPFIVC